ncbi:hypothetical protein C1645_769255 [Glomus cerebriforme]|uniref:Uncharacterized protein n=1 Tax=Glomus cerebriforme TaxID=658196 RepID=A0A397T6V6_9GLOM|nr:hypothetical protein C1645_769255 [Glomus cerebriforme]
MAYYSNWFKQTVNNSSESSSTNASITLLTPAQVTVSSIRDKLVYNIEYKPSSEEIVNKPLSKAPKRRARESTTSTANTFASANIVTARFQKHARSHSRRHSRNDSNESSLSNLSTLSNISEDSLWDDWIVKYKYLDKSDVVEDSPMEEWIFDTM